ncbi:MAG: hypothetical protein ABJQ29_03540 [Luteolibacter sp.]
MKIHRPLAIASIAFALSTPLHAERDKKQPDPQDKKQPTMSGAEIEKSIRDIEKELEATRKKTLEALSKHDAAQKDLEAEKNAAKELQQKATELSKELETIRKNDRSNEIDSLRKESSDPSFKNLPPEVKDATLAVDALQLKLEETYGTKKANQELEKTKKQLEQSQSAKAKAEQAANESRKNTAELEAQVTSLRKQLSDTSATEKKLAETQAKLDNVNRALEAQLKTLSDTRKQAHTSAAELVKAKEEIKRRDAEIEKLRNAPAEKKERPKKRDGGN